jgi:hypothetical protein
MKIIITEEQSNTISDKLKYMIKQYGLVNASKYVGGLRNLGKLGFNDNPLEFLNLFNDMDVVQSEENHPWTLFIDENGNDIMVYNRESNHIHVGKRKIWSILGKLFGLDSFEIREVIKEWLDEVYNLKVVTVTPTM